MPASVKFAKATPFTSRTSITCPAMNDAAVSLRLLMVTEARAMDEPMSIWRNSLLVEPAEMKRFVPVGAMSPSTAKLHRLLAEENENEVHALPSATVAPPDAGTATISLT